MCWLKMPVFVATDRTGIQQEDSLNIPGNVPLTNVETKADLHHWFGSLFPVTPIWWSGH